MQCNVKSNMPPSVLDYNAPKSRIAIMTTIPFAPLSLLVLAPLVCKLPAGVVLVEAPPTSVWSGCPAGTTVVCVMVVGLPFGSVVVKMLKDVTDGVELVEGLLDSEPDPELDPEPDPEPDPALDSEPDEEPDVSVGLLDSVDDGNAGEVEIEGELGDSVEDGDGESEEEPEGEPLAVDVAVVP